MRDDSEFGQRGLGHDGALRGAHDGVRQGEQRRLDRLGRGEVAAADRPDELGVAVGSDVAHDADQAGGAACEVGQVEFIDAAVVGQRRAIHDGHRLEQIALGVLDRPDPGVAGELDQCGRFHGDAGARRDVVEHHGQFGGVGHRHAVGHHAGLSRSGVVGADEQQGICPGGLGLPGALHAFGRVVGADTGDHPGPVLREGHHGADEPGRLGFGQRGRLAGGPTDDEAVAPGGQQVVDEVDEPWFADRAVGLHRGRHGDEVGAEKQVSGEQLVGHGSILPRAIPPVYRCFFVCTA